MNKEEYELLNKIEKEKENVISIDDLVNKSERTLLYGYTCDRNTWHVYIENNKIVTIMYDNNYDNGIISFKEKPMVIDITENCYYVPDKRVYPETCDYEFCSLLRLKGVNIPFTYWNDERKPKQFYGLTLNKREINY